jgi:hypothetical protein
MLESPQNKERHSGGQNWYRVRLRNAGVPAMVSRSISPGFQNIFYPFEESQD